MVITTSEFRLSRDLKKMMYCEGKQQTRNFWSRLTKIMWQCRAVTPLQFLYPFMAIQSARTLRASKIHLHGCPNSNLTVNISWPPDLPNSKPRYIELLDSEESRQSLRIILDHPEGPCLLKLARTYHTNSVFEIDTYLVAAVGVRDSPQQWRWPARRPQTKQSFLELFHNELGQDHLTSFNAVLNNRSPESYLANFPSSAAERTVTKNWNLVQIETRSLDSRFLYEHWDNEKGIFESVIEAPWVSNIETPSPATNLNKIFG